MFIFPFLGSSVQQISGVTLSLSFQEEPHLPALSHEVLSHSLFFPDSSGHCRCPCLQRGEKKSQSPFTTQIYWITSRCHQRAAPRNPVVRIHHPLVVTAHLSNPLTFFFSTTKCFAVITDLDTVNNGQNSQILNSIF